jgi:hypothetical protein
MARQLSAGKREKEEEKKRERNDGCTLNYKSITQFAFHYFESHFGIKPTFPGLYTVFGMLLKPGQNGGKKKTSIHPSIHPPSCTALSPEEAAKRLIAFDSAQPLLSPLFLFQLGSSSPACTIVGSMKPT